MGLYQRPDSLYWWMVLERRGQPSLRRSTRVCVEGLTDTETRELRRQAQDVYTLAKAKLLTHGPAKSGARVSFTRHADWWLDTIAIHHRGIARDRSMVRQLAAAFGGVTDLTQLTKRAAQEWMASRRQAVAPATVNRELDVLKLIMQSAVPDILPHNPLAGLRRLRSDERDPRVLTPEDEGRLLQACRTAEEEALLLTAFDTLLRLSSLLRLEWPQVKTAIGVIVPLNAKVSHDKVPITARMHDAIKKLDRSGRWVFGQFHDRLDTATSTAPKNRAIRWFADLCARANVPHGRQANGVTFHSLRHTGATRALQRGASVRTVMKLGGWRSERSVMRYAHAADLDVRVAAESISRHELEPRLRDSSR